MGAVWPTTHIPCSLLAQSRVSKRLALTIQSQGCEREMLTVLKLYCIKLSLVHVWVIVVFHLPKMRAIVYI